MQEQRLKQNTRRRQRPRPLCRKCKMREKKRRTQRKMLRGALPPPPKKKEYAGDGSPPEAPVPAAEPAAKHVLKYGKMWYKPSSSVNIRECFLNRSQLCSFRSPDQSFDEDALWELADRALDRLSNGGKTVEAVKTWLTSQGVHVSQPRVWRLSPSSVLAERLHAPYD